jgi:hypothetical protein
VTQVHKNAGDATGVLAMPIIAEPKQSNAVNDVASLAAITGQQGIPLEESHVSVGTAEVQNSILDFSVVSGAKNLATAPATEADISHASPYLLRGHPVYLICFWYRM